MNHTMHFSFYSNIHGLDISLKYFAGISNGISKW